MNLLDVISIKLDYLYYEIKNYQMFIEFKTKKIIFVFLSYLFLKGRNKESSKNILIF